LNVSQLTLTGYFRVRARRLGPGAFAGMGRGVGSCSDDSLLLAGYEQRRLD